MPLAPECAMSRRRFALALWTALSACFEARLQLTPDRSGADPVIPERDAELHHASDAGNGIGMEAGDVLHALVDPRVRIE